MTRQTVLAKAALLTGTVAMLMAAGCSSNSPEQPVATGGGTNVSASPPASPSLTIAVIPKGTTHEYWKSVQAGAEAAGKDLGAQIEWKGPLREDDRAGQIQIVQQFEADGVSGIVLAPLDNAALAAPVQSATGKNIPVVIIDSALNGTAGKDFVSLVATDNEHAGELGGERLAKLLGGKGKVVLLRYAEGSASTVAREAGFLTAMKKSPGITMISDNEYGGATQGEAQTKAMQMIDSLKQADGIFCPNESTTLGMLHALIQNNLVGKVKFVGFDASPPEIDALKTGQVQALVAQNPTKMGYDGVASVIDKIHGKSVPTSVDTGVTVIDKDNLNTPDVQKLLGL
jgi:ribose transport system substrate-binding protein